jgi:poly(A) polymerase
LSAIFTFQKIPNISITSRFLNDKNRKPFSYRLFLLNITGDSIVFEEIEHPGVKLNLDEGKQGTPYTKLTGSGTWPLIMETGQYLAGEGINSYLVGGWIRDTLLGRDTADIDIAVAGDALEIASKAAEVFGGTFVLLDTENKVARVVLDHEETEAGRQIDFSTIAGDIGKDLARRDFTVNAMAVRLGKDYTREIIDPFNGRKDLAGGIIRAVSDNVFPADAVRLLRAVRLAAELGFIIEKETETLIRRDSRLISGIAGERVREELLRLLAVPGAGEIIRYMDSVNLLTEIIPELAGARGVEQPKEHHWDVFQHSLRTVTTVEFVLRQGNWEYADGSVLAAVPWSNVLAGHFSREVSSGSTRRSILKLAALLHDINKPQTKAFDENGRMRFLGHGLEGAVTAAGILERLRFSSKEIKLVETEITHHLRPTQLSQGGLPSRRAIYRYFRDTGETGIDILFLSLADHLATRGPDLRLGGWQEHCRLVEHVIEKRFEQEKIVRSPKLVDGYDIINEFGVPPGPEVGTLLEAVLEAQAAGEVTSREEALSLIERLKKHA